MRQLGLKPSDTELEDLMNEIDTDRSGTISFEGIHHDPFFHILFTTSLSRSSKLFSFAPFKRTLSSLSFLAHQLFSSLQLIYIYDFP